MQGIRVSVGGYSDRLSVLLQTILSEMKTFKVDPERLVVYKEQVRRFEQRNAWNVRLMRVCGLGDDS